jgi:hypothetical protein
MVSFLINIITAKILDMETEYARFLKEHEIKLLFFYYMLNFQPLWLYWYLKFLLKVLLFLRKISDNEIYVKFKRFCAYLVFYILIYSPFILLFVIMLKAII